MGSNGPGGMEKLLFAPLTCPSPELIWPPPKWDWSERVSAPGGQGQIWLARLCINTHFGACSGAQ